eukprot:3049666-Amphidinium_carterae.1
MSMALGLLREYAQHMHGCSTRVRLGEVAMGYLILPCNGGSHKPYAAKWGTPLQLTPCANNIVDPGVEMALPCLLQCQVCSPGKILNMDPTPCACCLAELQT